MSPITRQTRFSFFSPLEPHNAEASMGVLTVNPSVLSSQFSHIPNFPYFLFLRHFLVQRNEKVRAKGRLGVSDSVERGVTKNRKRDSRGVWLSIVSSYLRLPASVSCR